ncbi:MAG TPA: AMP-binding protein [Aldersonia sp.]
MTNAILVDNVLVDKTDHCTDGIVAVPYPSEFVERYRAAGYWRSRSLPDEIDASLRAHAERTALVTADVRWTYAELRQQIQAFARGVLDATDLKPGDPVMFQMGNVAETIVAYLGAVTAGLRPVCTLPQHGRREIGLLARHVGARGLFTQADFGKGQLPDIARSLLADGTVTTVVVARGGALDGAAFDGAANYDAIIERGRTSATEIEAAGIEAASDHESIAVFQLSGGTTGLPKVAPRLHEEYVYNSRVWGEVRGWSPETTVLYPLPIMHNAGIALALQPALLHGATLVLAASADNGLLLDLIESEKPTTLPLVPPALAIRMLDDPRTRTVDLTCIEDYIVGGQRLPVEISRRLRDELGIEVRQMFGMAEGMFMVTPAGADEYTRFHTVGAPISPADEVVIADPVTGEVLTGAAVGELCVRGPYTIRGYYRADEHNANAFTADGFYRTGDLSRRHLVGEHEYYSIDGRIKDVINRGVEKIHAEEVEELIVTHPGVATVAVVAMPDAVLGERACAYLVMEPGHAALTVATLAEHLTAQGLAKYKLPERVEAVDTLPLSNIGKVSKKALREDITDKLRREHVAGA